MWQLNIWQFRNHQRRLQSPAYINDLQRDLMKWVVKREEKGLDTKSLHTAIYYLNDYKKICSQAQMTSESKVDAQVEEPALPNVHGFISRL